MDFFAGHAVSEIDRVYWARRVEELRKIYADRQPHLNPVTLKQEYDLSKIEGLQAKSTELENQLEGLKQPKAGQNRLEVKIVDNEQEIIELASCGWECQPIGPGKWLMKRPSSYAEQGIGSP